MDDVMFSYYGPNGGVSLSQLQRRARANTVPRDIGCVLSYTTAGVIKDQTSRFIQGMPGRSMQYTISLFVTDA